MRLENKKALVARTLNVGKGRIAFNTTRLSEIKEAITKQDIKDLQASGAIIIKEKKGRKKVVKRSTRRRPGSVKQKVKGGKAEYIIITRKLRRYVANLKSRGQITSEESVKLRKEIRTRAFKSLAHMKERIKGGKQ